jgi:flagellar biogenesis protein FliO
MVDGSIVGTLVRLVVSLAVVLLLLVFLARYLNHRQPGGGRAVGRPGRRKPLADVEVLSRHGLSRGSSLAVVRAGALLLLVGVTETSVTVLRELEQQPEEPPPGLLQDIPQDVLQDTLPHVATGLPQDLAAGRPVRSATGSFVEALREWTTRRG